jgi:hypothetical protein
MTQKEYKIGIAASKGLVAALIANLAIRSVAVATLDILPEFLPLSSAGPTILFTTFGSLGATGVFALVRRRAAKPEYVFRWIAAGVLLLSFAPDLWILGDGGAELFPGATPAGTGVLMVMHVTTAVLVVWLLTAGASTSQATAE